MLLPVVLIILILVYGTSLGALKILSIPSFRWADPQQGLPWSIHSVRIETALVTLVSHSSQPSTASMVQASKPRIRPHCTSTVLCSCAGRTIMRPPSATDLVNVFTSILFLLLLQLITSFNPGSAPTKSSSSSTITLPLSARPRWNTSSEGRLCVRVAYFEMLT